MTHPQPYEQTADAVQAILEAVTGNLEGDFSLDTEALRAVVEREAGALLPVFDETEQQAMDHLRGFMRIIDGWQLRANDAEMVAAIHVLQGFVIQHMLRRIVPSQYGAWFGSQSDDEAVRVAADVPRIEVELTEQFIGLDKRTNSPNFAGLPDVAIADVRKLTGADVGSRILLETRLAARLIGFSAATPTDPAQAQAADAAITTAEG